MKLVYCLECDGVVRLVEHPRQCECGRIGGYYYDYLNAVVWGTKFVPNGFSNTSFAKAVRSRTEQAPGATFEAWIIPKVSDTVSWFKTRKGAEGYVKREMDRVLR